jgi:hypothetical protein
MKTAVVMGRFYRQLTSEEIFSKFPVNVNCRDGVVLAIGERCSAGIPLILAHSWKERLRFYLLNFLRRL